MQKIEQLLRERILFLDGAMGTMIQRHRLVYDALQDAMKRNEIHALSIKASTPAEAGS